MTRKEESLHLQVGESKQRDIGKKRARISPDAMDYLGNPQRFGFPVFVIIDGDGNVLHIQDSALLEQGKGYNKKHIMRFLSVWTTDAVDPNRVSAE